MRRIVAFLCASTLVLGTAGAAAQADASEQERKAARALADKGLELFEAGHYEEALDRFQRAETVIHAPTHLLYMARALRRLGQLVEARERYARVAAEQLPEAAPKAFRQAQTTARSELAELTPRVPAVRIVVHGRTDAEVKLDGVVVTTLDAPIPLDPGTHRIEAAWKGHDPLTRTVVLTEGAPLQTVDLGEEPTIGERPEMPPPAPGPVGTGGGDTSHIVPAVVAFGVGAVGVGVGTVTGILAFGKASDLKDKCPENPCPSENQPLADSSRTLGTVSTVAFIAGGLGIGTGLVLLFLKPGAKTTSSTGVRVGPGWAALRGDVRW